MSATFNRGKLRKLAAAGRLVLASSYHFDDMLGEDRTAKEMPVAIAPENRDDRKEGTCYLWDHDFKSSSGCAYESGPGLVTLIVHSNSNYTFRIKEPVPS